MSANPINDSIQEKRQDTDELIREVIKKVPEEKKPELLAIINGFILGVDTEKKVG